MEFQGPQAGSQPEFIVLHLQWLDTLGVSKGTAVMWANATTPGFADRRLSVAAGNAVDTDFTGAGCFVATTPLSGSLHHHRIAGIALDDIPGTPVESLQTGKRAPVRVLCWGVTSCTVNFRSAPGIKESFFPLYADTNASGDGKLSDTNNGTSYASSNAQAIKAHHNVVGYTAEMVTTTGNPEARTLRCFIRCM